MIERVYQILVKFGYYHPIHPIFTHLVIGMVVGAFIFALIAIIFRSTPFIKTAGHCICLALVILVPTVLLGVMDWQHFYGGAPLFPIRMKLILAGLLLVFLIGACIFGILGKAYSNGVFIFYILSLLTVFGLGYFGGELVFGSHRVEKMAGASASENRVAEGAVVFQQNCSACHYPDSTDRKIGPGLKGIFKKATFPVSMKKVSEENFRSILSKPFDKMPPFGHLPEDQVAALVEYLKTF